MTKYSYEIAYKMTVFVCVGQKEDVKAQERGPKTHTHTHTHTQKESWLYVTDEQMHKHLTHGRRNLKLIRDITLKERKDVAGKTKCRRAD